MPRKRKRAPGAGRPPKGDFAQRTASLTMRITPETREAIEREANGAQPRRSVSQQAERLIRDGLELPERIARDWGDQHVWALARFVARAVEAIESTTRRKWCADPFTAQAVQAAINILMRRVVPDGPLEVPAEVEKYVQAVAHTAAEQEYYRKPEGVAGPVALGLLSQLETYEPPPLNHPPHQQYVDAFYEIPKMARAFGIKSRKEE